MGKTVKVTVTDHHFKTKYSLGNTTVNDREVSEVELTETVRNAVQAGNLELVEGDLTPERDEKTFQGNEAGGKNSEGNDDQKEGLEDKTKNELKEMCEEQGLKKSGTKQELIDRLKQDD